MKVLVVDDDEAIAEVTAKLLSEHGYETLVAFDGASALCLCAAHAIDVIVLDVFMPKKDGLETIKELHANQCKAKIVASSGVPRAREYVKAAQIFGAHAGLLKPYSIEQLIDTIEKVMAAPSPA